MATLGGGQRAFSLRGWLQSCAQRKKSCDRRDATSRARGKRSFEHQLREAGADAETSARFARCAKKVLKPCPRNRREECSDGDMDPLSYDTLDPMECVALREGRVAHCFNESSIVKTWAASGVTRNPLTNATVGSPSDGCSTAEERPRNLQADDYFWSVPPPRATNGTPRENSFGHSGETDDTSDYTSDYTSDDISDDTSPRLFRSASGGRRGSNSHSPGTPRSRPYHEHLSAQGGRRSPSPGPDARSPGSWPRRGVVSPARSARVFSHSGLPPDGTVSLDRSRSPRVPVPPRVTR